MVSVSCTITVYRMVANNKNLIITVMNVVLAQTMQLYVAAVRLSISQGKSSVKC